MWVFCCDCSLIWDRVKSGRIFFPLIYWKLQWLSFALTYFLSALFRVCSEQGFLFLYFCRFCSLLLLFYFIFNLLLEVRLKSSHNISDIHSFKARDGGTWKRVRVTQNDVHMRTKPGFSSSPPGCYQMGSLEPQSSFSSKPIPSAGFLSCCLSEDPTAWKLASEMASLVNKQHSGQLRARLLCLWKMRRWVTHIQMEGDLRASPHRTVKCHLGAGWAEQLRVSLCPAPSAWVEIRWHAA